MVVKRLCGTREHIQNESIPLSLCACHVFKGLVVDKADVAWPRSYLYTGSDLGSFYEKASRSIGNLEAPVFYTVHSNGYRRACYGCRFWAAVEQTLGVGNKVCVVTTTLEVSSIDLLVSAVVSLSATAARVKAKPVWRETAGASEAWSVRFSTPACTCAFVWLWDYLTSRPITAQSKRDRACCSLQQNWTLYEVMGHIGRSILLPRMREGGKKRAGSKIEQEMTG